MNLCLLSLNKGLDEAWQEIGIRFLELLFLKQNVYFSGELDGINRNDDDLLIGFLPCPSTKNEYQVVNYSKIQLRSTTSLDMFGSFREGRNQVI